VFYSCFNLLLIDSNFFGIRFVCVLGVETRILSTLLNELDGVEARRGVYVIATSRERRSVDAALLRPGRLDEVVPIAPPVEEDARALLEYSLRSVALAADVDLGDIARTLVRLTLDFCICMWKFASRGCSNIETYLFYLFNFLFSVRSAVDSPVHAWPPSAAAPPCARSATRLQRLMLPALFPLTALLSREPAQYVPKTLQCAGPTLTLRTPLSNNSWCW
jgi:hypothetical protein